jgi:hypothetical protein
MDPISQFNPVLDALRRQVAENIERLRKSGRLAKNSAADSAAPRAPAEDLDSILQRKLSAIDRRTPEGRASATRIFLETVLVSEFGEALLTDPGFGDLISEVGASLREDADIREQLDRMLLEL